MFESGKLAKTIRQRTRMTLARGVTPFYADVRQLEPSGLVDEYTTVMVLEVGTHFARCMCSVGVVWFKLEHLTAL